MIFIGYEIETKDYRFYDPISKKVATNRDVIFEEDSQWDWAIPKKSISKCLSKTSTLFDLTDDDNDDADEVMPLEESVVELVEHHHNEPYSFREEKPPRRFCNIDNIYDNSQHIQLYLEQCFVIEKKSVTCLQVSKEEVWKQTMKEEFEPIQKNQT